ncbi:hypothetical protein FRACA_60064 [Frankia canadensis]|uniref:Uncharacterized protein n=1 Tax=Frankia canadensis TaxID=1836972 RepID=A0A2I2KZI9_9ACTN|nr:hypothetical protein FRACA_60064 [Frankia canadensis]SOU58368.1 hypothetical protein FRACA_60064 [Frankia canadensis]
MVAEPDDGDRFPMREATGRAAEARREELLSVCTGGTDDHLVETMSARLRTLVTPQAMRALAATERPQVNQYSRERDAENPATPRHARVAIRAVFVA